jgi:twinkle protein
MGQCLVKLPHSCGSRDGLQVFENDDGALTGYCFSCKTYISNPLGEGKGAADIPVAQRLRKTTEEVAAELEEISGYQVMDLKDRKLRADALDYYNIKIGVSEQDGKTPTFQYFPYYKKGKLTAYKVKLLDGKKFWSVGDQRDVDLFGWEQAKASGARRLIITEGENDAVALKKIFEIYEKEEFKDTIPAICSLPHGAAAAGKDIARLLPEIKKYFKEVAFCFDTDAAGAVATDDCCKILPEAKTINLPCHDANDCLIEGKGKAAYQAAKWKAEVQKNTRIIWLDDVWEAAKQPAEWGVSWPWAEVTDKTRGIRTGETIYLGAAQKMG